MTKRISFSKEELGYLQHILRHFSDYIFFDDRPDHGLGILKEYRELPIEEKRIVCSVMAKIVRAHDKIMRDEKNN